MSDPILDAIIVGSGMTGGWAAKELSERGLQVLVLERGRPVEHGADYITEHKAPHEFRFRGRGDRRAAERDHPVQSRHWAFGEETQHFFINDRLNPYTTSPGAPFSWIRGWQVGGRSLLWTRLSFRLTDLDFEANAREGVGIDWPIRLRDIEPWYDHVESFIGISGEAGHPSVPRHLQPPLPINAAERHFQQAVMAAFPDRPVLIAPQAVLTEALRGRGACHYCGPCERGCSVGAYFSSQSSTLPAARATGNMTLRSDCIVRSITYDETTNRATGVEVMDARTREIQVHRAKLVFLCASAVESVRLLLNSASERFPTGLANSSGLLGRYLIDHVSGAGAAGILPQVPNGGHYPSGRSPAMLYIPRFRNVSGRDADFPRGYHMIASARLQGWERGASTPGIGAALKARLADPGQWTLSVTGQGESIARAENRVALNHRVRDAWGIPVPHFQFSWSDADARMRADMERSAIEMLEAAGALDIALRDDRRPPGQDNHEMGGARMGRDPRTSVLNGFNQAHDVPNLFVTDGACMVSSANQNPSLTYMALTARACDRAAHLLAEGRV